MKQEDWEKVKNMIEGAVQKKVNGKVDDVKKEVCGMREELTQLRGDIRPFLEGWKGGKRIGNVIKWVAGLIIAVGGAIAVLMNL